MMSFRPIDFENISCMASLNDDANDWQHQHVFSCLFVCLRGGRKVEFILETLRYICKGNHMIPSAIWNK